MAAIEVELHGFEEFEAKLRQMPPAVRGQIAEDAVTEGVGTIQFYAHKNASEVFSDNQRGQLRNSIIPIVHMTGEGAEAEIGPEVIYGRIQELGGTILPRHGHQYLTFRIDGQWRRCKQVTLPARPYLRPAVEDNQDRIINGMKDKIAEGLEEFGA